MNLCKALMQQPVYITAGARGTKPVALDTVHAPVPEPRREAGALTVSLHRISSFSPFQRDSALSHWMPGEVSDTGNSSPIHTATRQPRKLTSRRTHDYESRVGPFE